MTDVTMEHRRGIRRCGCGERHTREQIVYLRDQRAREVHPGGEAGARIAAWAAYRGDMPVAIQLSSERIEQLQRICRIHSQAGDDPRRCLAPYCRDRWPCEYRRVAEAKLVAADVALWPTT
jgi:hypothetical protein